MVHVAGAGVRVVRILEVEVIVAGLDLVDGDAPGLLILHTGGEAIRFIAPPGLLRLELLDADGFTLVIALGTRRIGVLVVLDLGGGLTFGEEQEVGTDAGVGVEHAVRQSDNGVQVALRE